MKNRTGNGRFTTNTLRKNASRSLAACLPNHEEEETISEARAFGRLAWEVSQDACLGADPVQPRS